MTKIPSSEITPEPMYVNRRKFMIGVGSAAVLATVAACGSPSTPEPPAGSDVAVLPAVSGVKWEVGPVVDLTKVAADAAPTASKTADELGDALNTFEQITNYNNYYEFSTGKEDVAGLSQGFTVRPWTVEVSGLVNNPKTYDIDDLLIKV